MQTRARFFSMTLAAVLLASCASTSTSTEPPGSPSDSDPPPTVVPAPKRLTWFGFVGVACGDDHAADVAGYSNVATTCAPDPDVAGLVADQLDVFATRGLRALLNVEGIFFTESGGRPAGPSGGPPLALRDDYAQRWDRFVVGAGLERRQELLAAVFVADEPTWRGVDPEELALAYDTVRKDLPEVVLLLVEAYPVLSDLVVPPTVDLVAFDRYGVADPAHDPEYLADLATLKAARSRTDQRVALIMETQWLPEYADFGFPPEAMATVAESYYRLAVSDEDVVGIVGYRWVGGVDAPGQLGARDLPDTVRETYRQIGLAIVGGGD